MWRLIVAVALLIGGLLSLITSRDVPDAFAKPVQQIYRGEIIEEFKVSIPVDGTYNIGLQVSRNPGESVQTPPTFPLDVIVRKNGKQVGLAESGGLWSSEKVRFDSYKFEAVKGEIVHISVRPGKSLWAYKGRKQELVVARFPYDYATYFLNVYSRRLVGIVGILSALATFLSYRRFIVSRSLHRSSGSTER